MPLKDFLFTSESVSEGHPDKMCDQVSDAVLDALIAEDPNSRVALETLVKTGLIVLAGEITSRARPDFVRIARDTALEIGYNHVDTGFDRSSCARLTAIQPPIPKQFLTKDTVIHVNPTGSFVIGGPHGDCGLTGRKIIVDTYGGYGRHGGGAFSGKDPSKVDRSACYMARYVAKNVVAAGLATKAEVQLAYAIGVAEPVSVMVDSFGTAAIDEEKITELVRENFKLTPKGIIEALDLRRPVYKPTAAYGHFGRSGPGFTWEKTDRADALRKAAGLGALATAEVGARG